MSSTWSRRWPTRTRVIVAALARMRAGGCSIARCRNGFEADEEWLGAFFATRRASDREDPLADGGEEIGVAAEELVQRVHGGAVGEEFGGRHAVFVVRAEEVGEFGAELDDDFLIDRRVERERRRGGGGVELGPPR